MPFTNEATYQRMKISGSERDFHTRYDDALQKALKSIGGTFHAYIGNSRHISANGTFEVRSPSDRGMLIGKFQSCSREETGMAVRKAEAAFRQWSGTDYRKRISIVQKAAEIAARKKFELAAMMTLENGKNRFEAMADVDEAIDFMRYYSELMAVNRGYMIAMGTLSPAEENRSVLRPYGVWGVIAPFNFPFAISCGMTTGALITGNTVVLKPSSYTPLLSLKLHEIYVEAGIPDGVLSCVTGRGDAVGTELMENESVSGIAFTGSREVGLASAKKFNSRSFKPFISEMGGKNAVIVTESADISKAVEGTAKAAFGFGGQKCSAASRAIVHTAVKDRFMKDIIAFTGKLTIGDPSEESTYLGPVISDEAVKRFEKAMMEARERGHILAGGNVLREGKLAKGYFVEPTIVDGLPPDSWLLREELFLPVLVTVEYTDFGEALRIANSLDYGLTAGIFSGDSGQIKRFFDEIEAGVCYANKGSGATTAAMVGAQPFTGWKMSGSTGKGAGGLYYLLQFMREQTQAVFS
jgi:1-pyrroline-5-carboxylate dehydrogenase